MRHLKPQELNIKIQDLALALLGFSLTLVQSFPAALRFPPAGMGLLILCHHTLEVCNLCFDSTGSLSEELALSLQRQFELFVRVRTVKTLRNLRYELNKFFTSEILMSCCERNIMFKRDLSGGQIDKWLTHDGKS